MQRCLEVNTQRIALSARARYDLVPLWQFHGYIVAAALAVTGDTVALSTLIAIYTPVKSSSWRIGFGRVDFPLWAAR